MKQRDIKIKKFEKSLYGFKLHWILFVSVSATNGFVLISAFASLVGFCICITSSTVIGN